MKDFMDADFLLNTPTAAALYHDYAEKTPVMDYHCHINPREIWEDRQFDNITQVWLGGDHYKWRHMRTAGVEEKYITGDASDREKFQKWAETIGTAIGNPLFHWSHLELRRFFGYEGVLNGDTAEEVWQLCNEKLRQKDMSARNLILRSNVTLICTTDDPVDDLCYHQKLAQDSSFPVTVLPAWRPDKAMNIEKASWTAYVAQLGEAAGQTIATFADMKQAMTARMQFFHEQGCRLSDHGLEYVMYVPADEAQVEAIFAKRMAGSPITREEELMFKTAFLVFMGRAYKRLGWTMQLHYGVKRDNNTLMFDRLGPDTGYDCISNYTPTAQLADFLNALACTDELPRTIVYSLNPVDDAAIASVIGCFQNSDAVGKVQQGSAWWFNDHILGMRQQMMNLASQSRLAGFVGMLTDSRSFLSYPRHEYFRRILCDYLGSLVEEGQFPDDRKVLGKIVQDVSYGNADRYFAFPRKGGALR